VYPKWTKFLSKSSQLELQLQSTAKEQAVMLDMIKDQQDDIEVSSGNVTLSFLRR